MSGSARNSDQVCPRREALVAMLQLPPENSLASDFREHLNSCPRCQQTLDELTRGFSIDGMHHASALRLRSVAAADSLRIEHLIGVIEERVRSEFQQGDIHQRNQAGQAQQPSRETSPVVAAGARTEPMLAKPQDAKNTEPAISDLPATLGRYQILKRIGRGGMGVIYLAYDPSANRNVAIKLMADLSAEHQQRLQREAEAIGRLQSEHVVRLFDIDVTPAGEWFIVMEFIDGPSLAERLVNEPALNIREAVEIVASATRGLVAAHAAGVLHRDLKPGNILLDCHLRPKLVDFGLARMADTTHSLTDTGTVMGTLAYLSPEQAAGRRVDHRSDVYSLGCVLYEAVTGCPPFRGTPPEIVRQIAEVDPRRPSHLNPRVPSELETIISTAMHKDPQSRYASANDLLADLLRFQRGEPLRARPTSTWERCRKWVRRNPWPTVALVAMFLMIGSLTTAAWLLDRGYRASQALNQQLLASNRDLDRARQQADKSFELTRGKLATMIGRLRDEFLRIPHGETLAIESIRQAAGLYQQLNTLRPDNQQVAEEYLQALKDLWYAEWLYQGDEAEQWAKTWYERESVRLLDQFPASDSIGALRADLLLDLADEDQTAGDHDGALLRSTAARDLLQQLENRTPALLPVQQALWKAAYQDYQAALRSNRAPADVVSSARRMVEVQRRVVELTPTEGQLEPSCILLDQMARLADALANVSEFAEARRILDDGSAILETLLPQKPVSLDVLLAQARLVRSQAELQQRQGDWQGMGTELLRLVELQRRIVADYPEGEMSFKGLAIALLDLAEWQLQWSSDRAAADTLCQEIEQSLLRIQSNSSVAQAVLADLQTRLSKLRHRLTAK